MEKENRCKKPDELTFSDYETKNKSKAKFKELFTNVLMKKREEGY